MRGLYKDLLVATRIS